jgi:acyl-CoA synthetase (AMP-forming)/AMP-acid ligase II
MTEAIWLTVCRDPRLERQGCIGRPVGGTEIRVAREDGQALPDGEIGEFWVKGPMVMREYWRDPDATARAFANGWFRTGDSGSRDADGTHWFAARTKARCRSPSLCRSDYRRPRDWRDFWRRGSPATRFPPGIISYPRFRSPEAGRSIITR